MIQFPISRLAGKQLLVILLFSSVITFFSTLVQLYFEYRSEAGYIESQMNQIKDSHLRSLTNSLWKLNNEQITIELNNILSFRDIVYLEITENNEIFFTEGEKSDEDVIRKSYPMIFSFKGNSRKIGVLHIYASLKGLYGRMLKRVFIILTTQSIKTFFVSFFILYIISRMVTRHMLVISNYIKNFRIDAKEEDLRLDRRPSPECKPDELDHMVNGINEMRRKLFRDMMFRKKAETELIRSERRFKTIVQKSPLPMVITDENQNPLIVNDKFTEQFGYTLEDVPTAGQWWETAYPDREYRKSVQKSWLDAIRKAKKEKTDIEMQEWEFTIKDRTKRLGEFYMMPLDDFGVFVVKDITEQRKIEKRILQAQRMESIGNLAGGIAHDFNNILFPVIGMSELLVEDLPRKSREYEKALTILQAGKRGSALVKQILSFSRKSEHSRVPIHLQQILKEVLKLIRAAIPSYVEIEEDIQKDCGQLMADPTQIHQVVMNIVTNAFHAVESEGGMIAVSLKQVALNSEELSGTALESGLHALLSVSDTGYGIPADLIPKIFDPYFTTKKRGKGTGLGLSVAYGIIREHQGEIKVYSEPGVGSTFKIYLPVMDEPTEAEAGIEDKDSETGTESILVVDDEEVIVQLEKQILERLGYRVAGIVGSTEALIAFKANPDQFDLVITDMNMPNMTGCTLTKELKAVRPDIPVIICTGFSERISREMAEEIGIQDFLMKPVSRTRMAETVRKVLDLSKEIEK